METLSRCQPPLTCRRDRKANVEELRCLQHLASLASPGSAHCRKRPSPFVRLKKIKAKGFDQLLHAANVLLRCDISISSCS